MLVSAHTALHNYNMDYLLRGLPLLLAASALAQYEGFEGYEGGFHHQPQHHGLQEHHHGAEEHHHGEYEVDYHAHPKYSFDYSVKDPHTGDDKEHWETRDGDKVKGSYTLIETDGTKRVVEYEADDKNGFNAVVHRIGTPKHEELSYKEPSYKEPSYKEPSYKEPTYHKEPEYHVNEHRGHEGIGYGHEPVSYSHEFSRGQYDDGFVPSFGH